MSTTQLSSLEIQDLINRYSSELKKLNFQVIEVQSTIQDLTALLNAVQKQESKVLSKRGRKPRTTTGKLQAPQSTVIKSKRGRKPKSSASVTSPETSTRKSKAISGKETGQKGYKLSAWDEAVIESLRENGKAMITSELVEATGKKAASLGLSQNAEEVKLKVVRSLQKLVNRRGDLRKVKFKGKGFAYAVPDWLSEKGRLLKEHIR